VRGVSYDDCVSRNDLVQKLTAARLSGKADPNIINKFNQYTDKFTNDELSPDDTFQATASDGNLPGGLSPEVMRALASDPEIIQMLRDPKMQVIMRDVMTKGPDGMKKYMGDPGN